MEFEYQHQPFIYNSFDPPPKDQGTIITIITIIIIIVIID